MDYSKIGLMQLRVYAKSIGVKSPTALKKRELIEKINEIESGKSQPYFSKKGRPQTNSQKIPNLKEQEYIFSLKKENNELKNKINVLSDKTIEIECLIENFKTQLFEILNKQ